MSILAFIVAMTQALAWPVSLFAVLLTFRSSLSSLIDRLASFRVGNWEAAFDKVAQGISQSDIAATTTVGR